MATSLLSIRRGEWIALQESFYCKKRLEIAQYILGASLESLSLLVQKQSPGGFM